MWWEADRSEEVEGKREVQIRSYVGGGMHGWAVAASQCCIRACTCREESGCKVIIMGAGSPACAIQRWRLFQ